MTTLTDFKAFLDPSLIQPHRRELWELLYLLLAEHDSEVGVLQDDLPIPISATTVTNNATAAAAFLAAAGRDPVIGDRFIAVVGAAQSLLVKTGAATWAHIARTGELVA